MAVFSCFQSCCWSLSCHQSLIFLLSNFFVFFFWNFWTGLMISFLCVCVFFFFFSGACVACGIFLAPWLVIEPKSSSLKYWWLKRLWNCRVISVKVTCIQAAATLWLAGASVLWGTTKFFMVRVIERRKGMSFYAIKFFIEKVTHQLTVINIEYLNYDES